MIDVCLLLEGTYPYVAGGVSTWVYDLLKRLQDKTFSIVYLGAHRASTKKLHYEIPPNVIDFQEIYLFDYIVEKEKAKRPRTKHDFKVIENFMTAMRTQDLSCFEELMKVVGDRETRGIDLYDLAHSYEGWEIVEEMYAREDQSVSFLDYFWTWRFLYLPFFALLRSNLPLARVYHAASTGYAGVLGSMCKYRNRRPFILTEHGIYTRERKIEIAKADWIYSESASQMKVTEGRDFFKEWWINIFSFFSKLSYRYADEIITLYHGNQKIQKEEGADPNKLKVIPNGVEVDRLSALPRKPKEPSEPFIVGFVGRVVPIKDLKTFIMACKKISDEIKNVEFYILGPTDEDEEYYRDCVLLAQMEALADKIHFVGKVDLNNYYPKLDVLVLTSISEAQPIVILEAGACGIPVVATDVGACSELIDGGVSDDKLLGSCGVVTPICDPAATARAVIVILKNAEMKKHMGIIGQKRMAAYYQMDDLIANYQSLYSQYGEEIRWRA